MTGACEIGLTFRSLDIRFLSSFSYPKSASIELCIVIAGEVEMSKH